MKTIAKMCALAVALSVSACDPDDGPVKPGTYTDPESFLININAFLPPDVEWYDEESAFFRWTGKATSSRVGEVNLSIYHVGYDFRSDNTFRISDGAFEIWTDDYKNTLSGNYSGHTAFHGDQLVTEGEVSINVGTGKFATKGGKLSLSIGRFIPFTEEPTASEIWVSGQLFVPDPKPKSTKP